MKRKALLFSLFIIPFSLFGQAFFGPENTIISDSTSGINPNEVFSVDIDSDGDLDILGEGGKIVWYENLDGNGNFGKINIIGIASDIFPEDIDGDGDIDIACTKPGKISWYENVDGNGEFGPEQIIAEEGGGFTIHASDIDNDGDIDILTGYGDKVIWFENENGLGEFGTSQIIISNTESISCVYSADLDGDGDMDVISSSNSGGGPDILWYENETGNGTFGTPQLIMSNTSSYSIHAADMDGDGDLDILAADSGQFSGEIIWFINLDGLGNFSYKIVITSSSYAAKYVHAGDINGDGDLDILYCFSSGSATWRENEDGNGTFGPGQNVFYETYGTAYGSHVGDMDGDGDNDVLVATGSDLVLVENEDGLGDFDYGTKINLEAVGARSVFSADLDGDGDMDVISASGNDDKIAWYENEDGLGDFGLQKIVSDDIDGATSVFGADLDGDGDKDVLAGGGDMIVWFENEDGLGTFGDFQTIEDFGITYLNHVQAVDIDGDGDLDVVYSASEGIDIAWHENLDGNGDFGNRIKINSSVDKAYSVCTADIDNDGDLDVLSASALDDKIAWFENEDGEGEFGYENIITTEAMSARSVFAADIDGDGDIDVLSASRNDDKIAWYENTNGEGIFSDENIITIQADGAKAVFATDFDNDGDMDVLYASYFDDKIGWFENINGQGEFGNHQIISTQAEQPEDVFVADIDNDGDLDILSASSDDHKIAWYKNFLYDHTLSGICYYDQNENKIRDAGEVGLLNQIVNVEPESIANFTNQQGVYFFAASNGNYTVSLQPDINWELSSDSASFSVTIEDTLIQNLHFGLKPIQEISSVEVTQSSAATRCGFEVQFWINYQNKGTIFASGQIAFELDPLTSFVEAEHAPDSIIGNTLIWDFNKLPPSYSEGIYLRLQMPSVDFLGETVSFYTTTYVKDDLGELQENDVHEYNSVINCSYDPNDKLVRPEGEQNENYTLFGEELEYTIRFQNTGTDTAFTVRIEDQLDANLDWNTFHPVAASHHYVANLYENGVAEFLFENILLPDSTTNEIESHGFVKYRIKALEGLDENTEIENTADIFFDFNPAIQTNTTLNTLVSEIPVGINELKQQVEVEVFPNPFEDYTTLRIGELPGRGKATLNLLDVNSRILKSYEMSSNTEIQIDGENLGAGIYFYEVQNNDGYAIGRGKIIKQ